MKMILELQATVKMLQESQQQMITHIASLEDTVITLSDAEDNSVEYKKAQRVAKKIKRKRIEKQRASNIDSDTSEENTSNR